MTLFLTLVLVGVIKLHMVVEKQTDQHEVCEAKGSLQKEPSMAPWGRGQKWRQGGL